MNPAISGPNALQVIYAVGNEVPYGIPPSLSPPPPGLANSHRCMLGDRSFLYFGDDEELFAQSRRLGWRINFACIISISICICICICICIYCDDKAKWGKLRGYLFSPGQSRLSRQCFSFSFSLFFFCSASPNFLVQLVGTDVEKESYSLARLTRPQSWYITVVDSTLKYTIYSLSSTYKRNGSVERRPAVVGSLAARQVRDRTRRLHLLSARRSYTQGPRAHESDVARSGTSLCLGRLLS